MKRIFCLHLLCLALSSGILAAGRQAGAALGGYVNPVAASRKQLSSGQDTNAARTGYTVRETESDATLVREYVSPSGLVFGVAWNGLTHPDLTQLLGSYAAQYKKALRQTPRKPGRRHHQVRADQVVVEKWGHMRNLQGRAYAPALIPAGVSADEIK
jgi:hypothetical protein